MPHGTNRASFDVKSLSDFEPEELASLADSDFQESIQSEARSLSANAFDVYSEVMASSDDDVARIKAADKIIAMAGFQERQQSSLPIGVSEEVFKLALAGLGQLAGIAKGSAVAPQFLRNVTPAKSDPRLNPMVLSKPQVDDSPMNQNRDSSLNDNDAIVDAVARERYEIINRQENRNQD